MAAESSAIAEAPLAKKKTGRPPTNRDDASARVDRSVLKQARMIADARDVPVAEYLTGILEGPVRRDYLKLMQQLEADVNSEDRAGGSGRA